jgi:hypothetical protein
VRGSSYQVSLILYTSRMSKNLSASDTRAALFLAFKLVAELPVFRGQWRTAAQWVHITKWNHATQIKNNKKKKKNFSNNHNNKKQ